MNSPPSVTLIPQTHTHTHTHTYTHTHAHTHLFKKEQNVDKRLVILSRHKAQFTVFF
jgi:hypothetical protein